MTDPHQTIEELRPIVEGAAEYQESDDRAEANIYKFRDAIGWLMLTAPTARSVAHLIARFAPLLTAYEELERRLALAEAEANVRRLAMVKGWSEGQLQWALDPDHEVADGEMVDALAAWRRATERGEGEGR